MAEYIDREDVYFRCSYRGDCLGLSSDCERCTDNVIDYQDFMKIPTADVVERSKVDKAIEKIKQDMIAHSGTGEEVIQAYCDGLKKALKYLENIGG
jgi:hypothetical protein